MQEKNQRAGLPWLGQALCPTIPEKRSSAVFWAAAFGGLTLLGSLLMGVLLGWTQNPGWPLAPLVLAGAALGPLLVQEVLRAAVYLPLRRFGPWKAGVLAALTLAAAQCLPGLAAARASGSLLPVLLEQGLPALVQSALLTALLAVGGVLPAAEYRLLALLPGLLPWLPAANRFAQVFLSLLLPLLFLIALSEDWSTSTEQQTAPAKGRSALAWAATAVPCLVLIAFFEGWLPAYPTAIATGSMEPEIQIGDMVVMARWGLGDIQPGDVIAVERQGRTIVHRVVEVRQEAGETRYITQGDANNAPDDEPAAQSQVEGRMIGLVPAVGRISLWFHTSG